MKMKFKDAPVGARFLYPNTNNEDIWVKINSYPKSQLYDGNGLIVKWNGNIEGNQSHCKFVDDENGIDFETEIELIPDFIDNTIQMLNNFHEWTLTTDGMFDERLITHYIDYLKLNLMQL